MVLFNSASFISLITTATIFVGVPAFAMTEPSDQQAIMLAQASPSAVANKTAAKPKVRRNQQLARYGVGLITLPQTAKLVGRGTSGATDYKVATETNGLMFSYDYEHRVNRWMFSGGGGIGLVGVRTKSLDTNLDYSYSKDTTYLVMASGTAYYITASGVRLGLGLRGFYGDYDLPVQSGSGITYTFEYGPSLKTFASVDLNWQLNRQWMFAQSLMTPLSKQAGTGWLLALKRTF